MAWAFSGALVQGSESSKRARFGPELEFCLFKLNWFSSVSPSL